MVALKQDPIASFHQIHLTMDAPWRQLGLEPGIEIEQRNNFVSGKCVFVSDEGGERFPPCK